MPPQRTGFQVNKPVRWEYDLLDRVFATRLNPLAVPAPGVFDEPHVCVVVNKAWIPHLLGALEALNQPDSWDGDSEDQHRARQQIEALIDALAKSQEESCMSDPCCPETNELLSNILVELRQMRRTSQAADTIVINQYMTNILNNYNGTPGSINPDAPSQDYNDPIPDTTDPNAFGNAALCAAIRTYLHDSIANELTEIQLALGFGGSLFGTLVGILDPVAGVVVGTIFAGITAAFSAPLQDADAFEALVCCVYCNLKKSQVSPETLKNSTSNCNFAPGSNAARLADLWYGYVAPMQGFVWFVDTLARVRVRFAAQPAVPDNPCENCTCEYPELVFWEYNSNAATQTLEKVNNPDTGAFEGVWRIRQSVGVHTPDRPPGEILYHFAVREQNYRRMKVLHNNYGVTLQGVFDYEIMLPDGTIERGAGGWTPHNNVRAATGRFADPVTSYDLQFLFAD